MYPETEQGFFDMARDEAIAWARFVMANPDQFLILDTETTGLDRRAEVVQVAVIDLAGKTIQDVLIKPMQPIPPEATRIHGITDQMVATAQPYDIFYRWLWESLKDRTVISYNADFDRRLLSQSGLAGRIPDLPVHWHCCMEEYAKFYGEWDDFHGSFRWQKLRGGDHSALGDCRATLVRIQQMAMAPLSTELVSGSGQAPATGDTKEEARN